MKFVIAINLFLFVLSLAIYFPAVTITLDPMSFLAPDNRSLLLLGATGTLPIDNLRMPFDLIGRWWTLVSASYLHGNLLHILFNMIAFWQIAPIVIREYGLGRMMVIYTLGGAAGFLISYFAGVHLTIGASAAICALMGSALYFGKSRGGVWGQTVYRQIGGWALGLFVFGLLVPGINNWGHGGGIVAGALIGFLLGYEEKRRESYLHRLMGLGCAGVTAVILIWAVASGLVYRLTA